MRNIENGEAETGESEDAQHFGKLVALHQALQARLREHAFVISRLSDSCWTGALARLHGRG